MSFITLVEAKGYLRVDSDYDDNLIAALLTASEALCCDIAKLSEDEWYEICAEDEEEEQGITPTLALSQRRALMRAAILYTLAYLYEHREEADHHDLLVTLRNILFAMREDKLL